MTRYGDSSIDPSRFIITADLDDSQVSGTSAVNSYGGAYTATAGGFFSVGELQSTLVGGSDEAMRAEALYFDLLRQARRNFLFRQVCSNRNDAHAEGWEQSGHIDF
ncbi:MAG: META domain-containing protein [Chloroflexota bacterium]